MMILSKQSIGFRSNSTRVVLLSHERHFVRHSPAIISNNWNASTAKGMSGTRLLPKNFLFGKQNKLGVTNEAW